MILIKKTKRTLRNWKYRFIELNKAPKNIYSSLGFHHHKCIFFHIPKTGGVSINHSLFRNLGLGHITVDFAKKYFSHKELQEYFKFSFVRNPYTRLISAYWYLKNGGFDEKDKIWAEENLAQFNNFEAFVMEWLTQENCLAKKHFLPQHYFIFDSSDNEIFVDFCGQYEQLTKDFSFICNKLNVSRKLLHHNSNPKPQKEIIFNAEMKKRIISCYGKDFELFNYSTNFQP